jgi:hypothetical protein
MLGQAHAARGMPCFVGSRFLWDKGWASRPPTESARSLEPKTRIVYCSTSAVISLSVPAGDIIVSQVERLVQVYFGECIWAD